MARPTSNTLTELELAIMRVLWEQEETTVEALGAVFAEQGRPLAPSSFRTMLGILGRKGYVARRRAGRGFLYRARVLAEDARQRILTDLLQRVFDGSASALMAALVQDGMVGKDDLARARQLLRDAEKEQTP